MGEVEAENRKTLLFFSHRLHLFLHKGMVCAGWVVDNKAVCCTVVRFIAVLSPLVLPCVPALEGT